MIVWHRIAAAIEQHGAAALITLARLEGSGPREAGARIVALPGGGFFGTIGGGALEYQALQIAENALGSAVQQPRGQQMRQALGPDLGQCCGGQTLLTIETFNRSDASWIRPLVMAEQRGPITTLGRADKRGRLIRRLGGPSEPSQQPGEIEEVFGIVPTPVILFGAGHVGRALALALGPLPFQVDWVDSRADQFPPATPGNVRMRLMPEPAVALTAAPAGTLVAVMTHSHPLDLALVALALNDVRFAYVGLIGSDTKRARFVSQLKKAVIEPDALRRLYCPIGGRRLKDKAPAVIAAAVVVELLEMREALTG